MGIAIIYIVEANDIEDRISLGNVDTCIAAGMVIVASDISKGPVSHATGNVGEGGTEVKLAAEVFPKYTCCCTRGTMRIAIIDASEGNDSDVCVSLSNSEGLIYIGSGSEVTIANLMSCDRAATRASDMHKITCDRAVTCCCEAHR